MGGVIYELLSKSGCKSPSWSQNWLCTVNVQHKQTHNKNLALRESESCRETEAFWSVLKYRFYFYSGMMRPAVQGAAATEKVVCYSSLGEVAYHAMKVYTGKHQVGQ